MDIEILVKKARSGDDDAFSQLIQMRKELLYRTAFTYVRTQQDALDIVSETVYKGYRSIHKLKDPALFNTWLTRILINSSLDFLKKQSKVVPLNETVELSSQSSDWAESMDLHRAVDQLDSKCRTVVILKYFHDMTISQIAEVLQCPQGTVKSSLHRALKNLRLELKEDWLNA